MTKRDIFELIIKTLALIYCVFSLAGLINYGISYWYLQMAVTAGDSFSTYYMNHPLWRAYYSYFGIVTLCLGIILFKKSQLLSKWAFPEDGKALSISSESVHAINSTVLKALILFFVFYQLIDVADNFIHLIVFKISGVTPSGEVFTEFTSKLFRESVSPVVLIIFSVLSYRYSEKVLKFK